MKKLLLSTLLVLLPLCVATWSTSQEVNDEACQQVIQASCTKCHGAEKICKKLDQADADWPAIVSKMSKKAKVNKETEAQILDCLTKSTDPKKAACPQK